ncbi:efflux RND transporter periplasmic adaptor subunit [Arcicella lustrica]|uniref:Efflux RND transporter periplasmic adaptor subunit n=1 Tax=Arcicella lustrica TaxID=2984196 RepID=A0ABU5SI72_9BACT|nr:efflux RND transporter periplasmic adaptor subunit [Arcicella sp. DC25W]MEA5426991.1 efflux RND transporter periplasmic adaptor subunit [Arcicella sp. DC25W]
MKQKNTLSMVSVGASICLALASCHSKKPQDNNKKEDQPAIVDVVIAKKQSISSDVEANGSIVANEFVELHTEVSGRITYLNIAEGTTVNQGTVLARINDADLQAQLNKTKVQLDLAEKTEKRLAKLLSINGISQGEYDTALNQVNSLKADLAYTQVLIEKTVLKAPFTGVLGLRQISQGAYVSPTTIIATIQQVNKLKVDFTVPEEYTQLIRKGTVVEVEVEGQKAGRCKAVVIAREPQINQTTRNLLVRALLSNCNANPGTFAKVYFSAGAAQNSILIPTNAIIPDDKSKKLVVVKDGKASYVTVETGFRQEDVVEITSGLSEGDSVVVDGVLFARPDKPVKVRGVKNL